MFFILIDRVDYFRLFKMKKIKNMIKKLQIYNNNYNSKKMNSKKTIINRNKF